MLLRSVFIEDASRERDQGNWEQARLLTEEALAVCRGQDRHRDAAWDCSA